MPSYNPTFGMKVKFENISLKQEPLLWPFLVVRVCEAQGGSLMRNAGCEESFTTIPLLKAARDQDIIDEQEYLYALSQYMKN